MRKPTFRFVLPPALYAYGAFRIRPIAPFPLARQITGSADPRQAFLTLALTSDKPESTESDLIVTVISLARADERSVIRQLDEWVQDQRRELTLMRQDIQTRTDTNQGQLGEDETEARTRMILAREAHLDAVEPALEALRRHYVSANPDSAPELLHPEGD